jgi:hypothetical protein
MKRTTGTHWIGGWVGPRAVLDAVLKRKIPSSHRESNLRTPIAQPVVKKKVLTSNKRKVITENRKMGSSV